MSTYQLIDSATDIPDVSIAMLAYNHEKFIGEAIESVLMQKTNYKYKIVIAEDGSKDNTRSILLEYQKKFPDRIRLILQDKNVGAQANNIDLLSNLEGKYVAALEGDDYWIDPLKLQKQIDFLETNPDFGLIFTDADLYYQNSKKVIKSYDKTFKRKIPTGNVLDILIEGNPYKTCTAVFRHELISDIFQEKILNRKGFGDKSLWMHMASKSKVAYLPESTSVYRVLESSASHFKNLHEVEHFFEEVYKDSVDNAKYYNIPIDTKRLRRNYNKAIITYCLDKNKYGKLFSFYKTPDLLLYLFAKEKIVRPLITLLKF